MTSETKICPGCGSPVAPGGRGMGKAFCSDPCRKAFHNRNFSEGGAMTAMVKAWHLTRHAPAGSREAGICRFARSQLTTMASHWIETDILEGRNFAVEYVESLMNSGTIWEDRHRGALRNKCR